VTGRLRQKGLAGIEYAGCAGASSSCYRAVERLLQAGERVQLAVIMTAGNRHGLLLKVEPDDWIAVKTGFASGYAGGGPAAFARTLRLLEAFDVSLEEVEFGVEVLDRLDRSALNVADLDSARNGDWIRPWRLSDYIYAVPQVAEDKIPPQLRLPVSMPWGLLDPRLLDLAKTFEGNPDHALLTGFRRLEDLVRAKLDRDAPEGRAFATAFSGNRSQLHWEGLSAGEHSGRAQLFTGAYSAFRNPRAHKELDTSGHELLQQFLLLNLLYQLEVAAVRRPPGDDDQAFGSNDKAQGKPR